MLIEIYDYAAKLLNNMTATTATIINNLTTSGGDRSEAEEESEGNPGPVTNLTSKLLHATTGNMKSLLNRTLATMGGQNGIGIGIGIGALPTLLLHGVNVSNGQRIKPTIGSISSISISSSNSNITNSSSNNITNISTTISSNMQTTGSNITTTTASNISSIEEGENLYNAFSSSLPSTGNLSGFIESSTTAASNVLGNAITHLPQLPHLATTTTTSGVATTFPTQTMATFIAAGNKNRPTIILYPTGE